MQPADPPDTVPASSPPMSPFRTQRTLGRDDVQLRRAVAPAMPAAPPHSPATTTNNNHFPLPVPPLSMKIHLWMPYADLVPGTAARSGWSTPASTTVCEAKTAIASGAAGYGQWDPVGLRLIWRGRLLGDDEVFASVFDGVDEPTVHVVARPLTDAAPRAPKEAAVGGAVHRGSTSPPPSSAQNVALADTIHYLIFVCREHMCAIIGRRPLAWEDTYPAPTVSRAEAYEAILTVVRAYAGDDWTTALQGDGNQKALEGAWLALGSESMTAEVGTLWRTLVGREYGRNGDVAQIELDLETLSLHLPALQDMVPAQLTHLLFYLRTASLVRFLSGCLAELETASRAAAATPEPTPTVPETNPAVPHGARVMYQSSIRIRVPRVRVSFALLQHLFWSAMRILTILWMLTRGMPWSDTRLWLLVCAAGGWWAVDGFNHWIAEDRARRTARLRRMQVEATRAAADAHPGGAADGDAAGQMDPNVQAAADAVMHAAAARGGAGGIRARQPPAVRRPRGHELLMHVPYVHLDIDAAQTRIRSQRFHGPGLPAPRHSHINTLPSDRENERAPELLAEPRTRPHWLQTQVLLPIGLWFLTLIPAFEMLRAREIRHRERAMRAVIKSLNPETETETNDDNNNTNTTENDNENTALEGSHPADATPTRPMPPRELALVLPSGLSEKTRKYYARVAKTTEMIDWEEEREAQRAMGIPDEDEGAAAGAGFMAALL